MQNNDQRKIMNPRDTEGDESVHNEINVSDRRLRSPWQQPHGRVSSSRSAAVAGFGSQASTGEPQQKRARTAGDVLIPRRGGEGGSAAPGDTVSSPSGAHQGTSASGNLMIQREMLLQQFGSPGQSTSNGASAYSGSLLGSVSGGQVPSTEATRSALFSLQQQRRSPMQPRRGSPQQQSYLQQLSGSPQQGQQFASSTTTAPLNAAAVAAAAASNGTGGGLSAVAAGGAAAGMSHTVNDDGSTGNNQHLISNLAQYVQLRNLITARAGALAAAASAPVQAAGAPFATGLGATRLAGGSGSLMGPAGGLGGGLGGSFQFQQPQQPPSQLDSLLPAHQHHHTQTTTSNQLAAATISALQQQDYGAAAAGTSIFGGIQPQTLGPAGYHQQGVLHQQASQQLMGGLHQSLAVASGVRGAAGNHGFATGGAPATVPAGILPMMLALPEDNLKLSCHQVFLRHQIEAFQATEDDVSTHTRGRNKPITLGQVGIRCRHCAHLPVSRRQKGSTYFPASLLGLYQAAQNMSTTHMQCGLCTEMPLATKQQFVQLLTNKSSSSGAGRPYWAKAAAKLGLVDTEDGIRSIRDARHNHSGGLAAAGLTANQPGR